MTGAVTPAIAAVETVVLVGVGNTSTSDCDGFAVVINVEAGEFNEGPASF